MNFCLRTMVSSSCLQAYENLCQLLFRQNLFGRSSSLASLQKLLPLRGAPSILVGGTNGKGSVASALSSVLQAHGLKVGLFTSPHLVGYAERFRVNGTPLGDCQIMEFLKPLMIQFATDDQLHMKPAQAQLSFFEISTLLGAHLFEAHECEVNIFEVGIGGINDATNALNPELSVLTTIGYDHVEVLGHSLDQIVAHKVGILRPSRPCVLGVQEYPQVLNLIQQACPFLKGEDLIQVDPESDPTLKRHHLTAFQAAKTWLGPLKFNAQWAYEALRATYWPGRFDLRQLGGSTYLLDGAHNLDACQYLVHQLKAQPDLVAQISSMVFAIKAHKKDLLTMVTLVSSLKPVPVYGVRDSGYADPLGLDFPVTDTGLLADLMDQLPKEGICLVFGSLYVVGDLLKAYGVQPQSLRTHTSSSLI